MFALSRDEQKVLIVVMLALLAVVIATLGRSGVRSETGTDATVAESNNGNPVTSNISGSSDLDKLVVHVTGEVLRPRLYEVPEGTRVYEVLGMAGLTALSDAHRLNLAAMVKDGQKLVVPRKGAGGNGGAVGGNDAGGLVNINTATKDELKTLSGIGEVYAGRIIEYRKVHPFRTVEEIVGVSGIGEKTFEKIRDRICVE